MSSCRLRFVSGKLFLFCYWKWQICCLGSCQNLGLAALKKVLVGPLRAAGPRLSGLGFVLTATFTKIIFLLSW
jgi:hypothetical protein